MHVSETCHAVKDLYNIREQLKSSYNYIAIIIKHFFLPSQFYTFGFKSFFFHVQRFSYYRAKYKPNLFPGFTKQEWFAPSAYSPLQASKLVL